MCINEEIVRYIIVCRRNILHYARRVADGIEFAGPVGIFAVANIDSRRGIFNSVILTLRNHSLPRKTRYLFSLGPYRITGG